MVPVVTKRKKEAKITCLKSYNIINLSITLNSKNYNLRALNKNVILYPNK